MERIFVTALAGTPQVPADRHVGRRPAGIGHDDVAQSDLSA
jgi:hypothetical protein